MTLVNLFLDKARGGKVDYDAFQQSKHQDLHKTKKSKLKCNRPA